MLTKKDKKLKEKEIEKKEKEKTTLDRGRLAWWHTRASE